MDKKLDIGNIKKPKLKFKAPSVVRSFKSMQNPGQASKVKAISRKTPTLMKIKAPKSISIGHSLSKRSKKLLEKVLDKNF